MRCYNGCPDSDLQRVIDAKERARKAIVAAGYWPTYFPNGEFWMGFNDRHIEVTGKHGTIFGVAHELGVST